MRKPDIAFIFGMKASIAIPARRAVARGIEVWLRCKVFRYVEPVIAVIIGRTADDVDASAGSRYAIMTITFSRRVLERSGYQADSLNLDAVVGILRG